MTMPNGNEQARILELLEKLSQDNAELHRKIASLGQDIASIGRESSNNGTLAASLQNRPDNMGEVQVALGDTATEARDLRATGMAYTGYVRSSQTSWTGAHVEFKFFSRLPPELRLRIWKFVCFNEPRVIHLRAHYSELDLPLLYCLGNHPPPILHANSESRTEARKWFKRRAVDFQDANTFPAPAPETYMNFNIDILCPVFDEYWKGSFFHDWAEVLTKHRAIRHFHRVAIPHNPEPGAFEREWRAAANQLVKPRSKIDDLIIIHGSIDLFKTESQLTQLPLDYHMCQEMSEYNTESVEYYLDLIFNYTAEADIDGDGWMIEDDSSDNDDDLFDNSSSMQVRNTAESRQLDITSGQKRSPPKVTYMTLKEVHPPGSRWAVSSH